MTLIMIFLAFTSIMLLQTSSGQLFSIGGNFDQISGGGFPLALPEEGINPNVEVKVIANAVRDFAQDASISLWKEKVFGNVVFSPLSMQTILALLLLGTRGLTYIQLKDALFFKENVTDAVIHESFQYVLGLLEGASTTVKFDVSSVLFVQKGIPISGTYQQISQALYDANVVGVNFRTQPVRATRDVNKYVRIATNGKIPRILTSLVNTNTIMIAVSAISFNGPWKFPFDKDETKRGIFDTGFRKKNVLMMHNILKVPFVKRSDLGFDMISLPYLNSDISLYILVPTGNEGVSSLINVESGLSLLSLENLIAGMRPTLVDVTIPRIKIKFSHNFKSHLQGLGATAIFNPTLANFGRMTTSTDFAVKDIIHEAILEITETGTIAAAATVTTVSRSKSEYFVVDKPSLLFIRDNSNGIILFWARVVDP